MIKKWKQPIERPRGKRAGTELLTAGLGYRGWRWYGFTLLSIPCNPFPGNVLNMTWLNNGIKGHLSQRLQEQNGRNRYDSPRGQNCNIFIQDALFGAREVKKTSFIAQLSTTEVGSASCEAY